MPHQEPVMPRHAGRLAPLAAALAAAFALAQPAHAFEVDTGNPDLSLRWDNTLRYNLGVRTQSPSAGIEGNPNYDDGDRNFDKGSLVTNRLDVLSEADLVWARKLGARVSAAGWYDAAYAHLDDHLDATANTLVDGVPTAGALSGHASRLHKGPAAEVLDAFVFANTQVGSMPVTVRLGRHTVFWGETLGLGGAVHGVSYGQYSIDLAKGLATPGAELKELFRPRNALTVQAEPVAGLSVSGQYFLDWESVRYPESGSYLGVGDMLLAGGDTLIVGPGQRLLQGASGTPRKSGDWGLSTRWSPDWLNGTAGLYLRHTADIQPQLTVTPAAAALPAGTCGALGDTPLGPTTCYINPSAATPAQLAAGFVGQYNAYYARNIDILGLSLARDVGGISTGLEINYRRHMPLASVPVTVLPAGLANPAAGQITPAQLAALGGDAPGARGNTLHGVVTLIGSVARTPAFDSATWSAELVWNRWLSVTDNAAAFKGSAAYRANPANVDAVTRDFLGLGVNFTPTWYQVRPSVDLSLPVAWTGGLAGNSAVVSGGNRGGGNFSVGVAADIQSRYNVALRYVGFYGDMSKTPTGAMNVPDGTMAQLADRGHVVLTIKSTF